jgi:cytochrome c oxidase subunit 2
VENFLGLPLNASANGAEIDRVLALVHVLIFTLFIGWSIFLVVVLIRFRKKKNPHASYTGTRNRTSIYVEIGVALFEVILLTGFSIPLWSKRVNDIPKEQNATVVHIIAEQFSWNIHYPGPDGEFGRTDIHLVSDDNPIGLDRSDPAAKDDITTVNDLHLPVNKPALIYLSSKDVVHSLSIPVMRIKQDAIPGQVIPVWFVPTVANNDSMPTYDIACAQLCGLGHYRMRGYLTVQSQHDFDEWIKGQEESLAESQ